MSQAKKTRTEPAKKLSRREIAGLAAGAAVLAATPAEAAQVKMLRALGYCEAGLAELHAANPNKGGHRRVAIEHLEYVIAQIKEGISHANQN